MSANAGRRVRVSDAQMRVLRHLAAGGCLFRETSGYNGWDRAETPPSRATTDALEKRGLLRVVAIPFAEGDRPIIFTDAGRRVAEGGGDG